MPNPHAGTYGPGHSEQVRRTVDEAFHLLWREDGDLGAAIAQTDLVHDQIDSAENDSSIPQIEKLMARGNAGIVCGRLLTLAQLDHTESAIYDTGAYGAGAIEWFRDSEEALKDYRKSYGRHHQFMTHLRMHAAVGETLFGEKSKAFRHLGAYSLLSVVSESPRYFDHVAGLTASEAFSERVKRAKGAFAVGSVIVADLTKRTTLRDKLARKIVS